MVQATAKKRAARSGGSGKSRKEPAATSLDRALALLRIFSKEGEPLSFAFLAKRSGLGRTTLLRLIGSLTRHGYLQQLEDERYEIGFAALTLAAGYRSSTQPAEIVMATLQRLVKLSAESATFFVADGDERVCVYRVDSPKAIRDFVRIGTRLPMKYGAGGRVLMAFGGAKGKEFDAVRERYMAASTGEIEPDESSISVPIFAPESLLFGAIVLSGPRLRFGAAEIARIERPLLQQAADLTARLGGDAAGLVKAFESRRAGQRR